MKKEKYLSDNEVVKAIREYIDNHIYNYAVLIDGQWGCGKTYFIKNILMKELSDHIEQNKNQDYKNIIYISLYGIKNTNEISKQIYVNVIDKTKENDSEGVKKIKSIFHSFLDTYFFSSILSYLILNTILSYSIYYTKI